MTTPPAGRPGPTWYAPEPPPAVPPFGAGGWLRIGLRGALVGAVVFGGLALLLALRLPERLALGARRPVTPWITVAVCRAALWLLGLRVRRVGRPMPGPGVLVANHVSWLDIFALNAAGPLAFVSKSEVAGWPGIGWLARATGTVFITRSARDAAAQRAVIAARLAAGDRLVIFPEGTSTDGRQVLPFKPTLFAALFAPGGRGRVQPVSLRYAAPAGRDARFHGWWGDMDFGAHLLAVLAAPRGGAVALTFHAPLRVGDFPDRKALAAACTAQVRTAA